MQNNIKIILTTENKAKFEALNHVCKELFNSNFEIISIASDSNVNETPTNDNEAISGCINRIKNIQSKIDYSYDYIVSLEGLIQKTDIGTFVYGWAVIKTYHNIFSYGCSGKVMLPNFIANKIKTTEKLSDLIRDYYPNIPDEKRNILGANGIITNGLYTRVDEFITSIKCAFGSLDVKHDKKNTI
ncbi:hypothetical protein A1D23_12815 [Chelonobacter oris]|uniref:inosine/xanthosine triphosphatase n=1 Tax=Chelonobacter oris TaxID=505317 RepID=UPI00244904AD|nr:inosine/xanthosine triphosphatase [Chelonobacter oris]MDH3001424.1 hypothetical protein [Chelonobacter oris]